MPSDIVDLVKQVSKLDEGHLSAVRRTVAHSEGISITAEKLLQERLYLLEQDAEVRISELEAKLLESKRPQGGDYESKFKQLSSELYPALARLRELVPDERW